jgi:hypothetical protein
MASPWLSQTIGGLVPSAGLERPLKVTNISIETTAAPGAAGAVTITDGSAGANVLYERQLPATANLNVIDDFETPLQWRNFQLTVIPTNTIVWINRR